jgi:hypothetical protein
MIGKWKTSLSLHRTDLDPLHVCTHTHTHTHTAFQQQTASCYFFSTAAHLVHLLKRSQHMTGLAFLWFFSDVLELQSEHLIETQC